MSCDKVFDVISLILLLNISNHIEMRYNCDFLINCRLKWSPFLLGMHSVENIIKKTFVLNV